MSSVIGKKKEAYGLKQKSFGKLKTLGKPTECLIDLLFTNNYNEPMKRKNTLLFNLF